MALDHFNKAIILSHEEAYHAFEAAALERRGAFFFDTLNLKRAIQDFNAAAAIDTPPQLQGAILAIQGLALMNIARSDREKTQALNLIDQAEHETGPTFEDVLYQQSLPQRRYLRYRARALMAAPVKQLRSPEQATEILDELSSITPLGLKRLDLYQQVETNMVQAQVWVDQGYDPIATTTAQESLDLMKQVNSYIHLPALTRIHEVLKTSFYGKSVDVARLGSEIIKAKHFHLFD
jgi:tetratricopeptide (TPR) repeat protein